MPPAVLLGLLAAFPAFAAAQTPVANAPEVSTHDAPATFRTGVNLVLVPVVLRDRDGHAVGTLHREDFELFDKNKPQVITRFSVEKPGTAVAVAVPAADPDSPTPSPATPVPALAEHFIAYVFDDVHLQISDLLLVKQAATRHLTESLEPGTRAAIFTTSGRGNLDFTDDRDKLRDAVARVLPWTTALGQTSDCPYIPYYMADLIVNRNDPLALAAGAAEASACDGSTSSQAQLEAQSAAQHELTLGDQETRLALSVIKDVIRRVSVMPGSRTIVLASPGFFLTIDHRSDETDLMDRAIRANITIHSLDARGLYNPSPEVDASRSGRLLPIVSQYVRDSASADADVLAELADATGGTFFQNDNDLREGFRRLASQPEYVYVLGFSPQNLKLDGTFHRLKVSVRNGAVYSIQARRGFYAPKHAIDPEEEAKEEIREAVFSREELRDIPVELNLQYFKSSDVNAKLSVLARVDIRQLRYHKVGDRNNDVLRVVSGVFDRNGNFVTGTEKIVDLRLRDQTLAGLPASGISIKSSFDLPPGAYVLRLVVRDTEGQTMSARNGAVQIP
jgi:VWFA-related protein